MESRGTTRVGEVSLKRVLFNEGNPDLMVLTSFRKRNEKTGHVTSYVPLSLFPSHTKLCPVVFLGEGLLIREVNVGPVPNTTSCVTFLLPVKK